MAGIHPSVFQWGFGAFLHVERGVRTHVNVDPAELFARILALRPEGFFLFHNHPSGNPAPSETDQLLTIKVMRLSQQLGLRLLGHGVVSSREERWVVV